jgi:hypothetical protein
VYSPIAVHDLAELHETPFSVTSLELVEAFAGVGVRSTRQVLPFHRSANVGPPGPGLKSVPVAVHAVADVQDTASKVPAGSRRGNGTACTFQVAPFQDRARGRACPVTMRQPTAVHARALEHDTPASWVLPPGWGVASRCQRVPFHVSTIARPGSIKVWPTATHERAEVQETP